MEWTFPQGTKHPSHLQHPTLLLAQEAKPINSARCGHFRQMVARRIGPSTSLHAPGLTRTGAAGSFRPPQSPEVGALPDHEGDH